MWTARNEDGSIRAISTFVEYHRSNFHRWLFDLIWREDAGATQGTLTQITMCGSDWIYLASVSHIPSVGLELQPAQEQDRNFERRGPYL